MSKRDLKKKKIVSNIIIVFLLGSSVVCDSLQTLRSMLHQTIKGAMCISRFT